MIYVAGFGHPHYGVNEQTAANFFGCAAGEFLVDAVHGVAGLKGDYVLVAGCFQQGAGFRRGAADIYEIVVNRQVDDFQLARDAQVTPLFHFGDQRVTHVCGSQHQTLFALRVPGKNFFNAHDRDQVVARIAQRDPLRTGGQVFFFDGQGNRHREECAVRQAHFGEYALVIRLAHEAIQRRVAAYRQQFQIVKRAVGNLQGGVVTGLLAQHFALITGGDQVNQFSTIGRNEEVVFIH